MKQGYQVKVYAAMDAPRAENAGKFIAPEPWDQETYLFLRVSKAMPNTSGTPIPEGPTMGAAGSRRDYGEIPKLDSNRRFKDYLIAEYVPYP